MKKKNSKGHGSTEPDPKEDQDQPLNEGNPSGIKKSEGQEEVEVSELSKALSTLGALIQGQDEGERKQELLSKAMESDLTPEENEELMAIFAQETGADEQPSLSKSVLAGLDPEGNDTLQKSIEVSDYLTAHHSGTVEALDALATHIEKSESKQDEFNLVLAKSIFQVGRTLEDLQKSIEAWGNGVPNRPKSAQTQTQGKTQVMAKSFGGGQSEEGKLGRADILNALENMNKSMGGQAPCGEDLTVAISKFEQTNKMSRNLFQDVQQFVTGQPAA